MLLKQHEALQARAEQQRTLIASLTEKEKQQAEEIELLRQKQLILKASLESMDDKEKKALEQKINNYIRNIDKCISLLSHEQRP